MIQGYNHNIRHKGRLYHVQTEDTGQCSRRVHTLLFMDGHILASKNLPYGSLLDADPSTDVRALMMQQHKTMLLELKDGKYDVADTPNLAEASLISRELVAAVKESVSLCAEPHDVSQTNSQKPQPLQDVTYTELPAWNTTGQVVQRGTEELVPFSVHRNREWVSAQEELALSSKDAHPQAEQASTFSTSCVAFDREEECFSVELDAALAASSEQLLAMNSGEFLAITDEGESSLQLAGMSLLQGLSSNDTTLIADSVRKLATASDAIDMRSLWWLTPILETVS